jgi:serine protease Do
VAGRPSHSSRARVALAIAVSATSAILVAAFITTSFRPGGGGAAAVVEPTASSYSFAPTTVPDLPDLARPPDGVVHLVATTSSGQHIGSGVVLDTHGTIATTAAAVAGATSIVAYLADGSRLPAVLLGMDDESGAAVVSINAATLPATSGWAVTLATGDSVHTGDERMTASVDALGVSTTGANGRGLAHLVSLDPDPTVGPDPDAKVAEGTPLLDHRQQVVGLCTYGDDDTMYAVPIEIPRAAARSIAVHGRVVVPWLGVSGNDMGAKTGAVVRSIGDASPAAKAGIAAGDVIVAIDGQPVDSMAVLALSLRDYDAGAMVDLAYVRDGLVRHASAVLVERPSH